jgi:hypothetical protein
MAYNPYGEIKGTMSAAPIGRIDEPVSFLQDDHPALSRNLLRDLQIERAKQYEGLIAAKDWPDFEKRRGLIKGIDAAIDLCAEAKKKLEA